MLRCQCIVFDPELMISHLKWIVMNLCYTGLQKLAFNLSNPSYSSLSLTEGSCTAEGFSESYSISANSGIQCVDERVTAPRVKCLFVFFYPVCAGVCVCWANLILSTFTHKDLFICIPGSQNGRIVLLFWRHALKMQLLSLLLDWSPGKTVTSVWVGKVVGIDSWLNFSNFPSLPQTCYRHLQTGGHTCKCPHFYSLTAKCTDHKCSSSVSYVYLI